VVLAEGRTKTKTAEQTVRGVGSSYKKKVATGSEKSRKKKKGRGRRKITLSEGFLGRKGQKAKSVAVLETPRKEMTSVISAFFKKGDLHRPIRTGALDAYSVEKEKVTRVQRRRHHLLGGRHHGVVMDYEDKANCRWGGETMKRKPREGA